MMYNEQLLFSEVNSLIKETKYKYLFIKVEIFQSLF